MTKTIFTSSNFGLVPERTARRNTIESALLKAFVQYGYNEVSLPMYEYYDILKSTTHNFRDENIISFIDRTSGKSLVLRPDFTPQVCRMVAGYHKDFPLPIRVFYRGTVFRNVSIDQGAKAEKYQIGCELYGTDELEGDQELLLLLRAAMEKAGIDDYRIVFGDAAYLSRVLELLGEYSGYYMPILTEKRFYETGNFNSNMNISEELMALARYLPSSFGGSVELDTLSKLSKFDAKLSARCGYLKKLFSNLEKHGLNAKRLVFDAGEIRGLEYYTGVSFEIFHSLSGELLGGGGRYDTLMKKFHLDYTACGMALYLSEMEALVDMAPTDTQVDWIVVGKENIDKAESLRKEGYSVIHLFDREALACFTSVVKAKNIFGDR